jgi:hypothetical protein
MSACVLYLAKSLNYSSGGITYSIESIKDLCRITFNLGDQSIRTQSLPFLRFDLVAWIRLQ